MGLSRTGERIVDVKGLGRRFGDIDALRSVDLDLKAGEIVALAGPNGSGKTTLLKVLAGLLRPTHGSVRVLGRDPSQERAEVMRQARFAFAPPPLYDALTAREHLVHLAALGSSPGKPLPSTEIEKALRMVGLGPHADRRAGTYSFGMRQRLSLAQCLVPMPLLLVLDEPTDGLDPLAILELRGVLERLRSRQGVSILFSSHLLIEVEKLVDQLLVLDEGRVLFSGRPSQLLEERVRLEIVSDQPQAALEVLREQGIEAERSDGLVWLPDGALSLGQAQQWLSTAGIDLIEFRRSRPGLESLLMERIREARDHTFMPRSTRPSSTADSIDVTR